MYNLQKNNYHQKPKNSIIYTPPAVSQFIFELLKDKIVQPTGAVSPAILDPCCGQGSLLEPWKKTNRYRTFGNDIDPNCLPGQISRIDFLQMKTSRGLEIARPQLILCHPPFNGYKGKAAAEVWLDKIIELFGKDIPIVLFAPYNFRLPWKTDSKRLSKFLSGEYPPIASIISLPTKGLWEGVIFHSEILIFNIKGLKPHYFFNPTNQIEQRTPI